MTQFVYKCKLNQSRTHCAGCGRTIEDIIEAGNHKRIMEKHMNFDDYQKEARTTAIYEDIDYPRLALAEEVGELLGKIAKAKRDHRGYINEGRLYDIKKEGGDILWQLAAVLGDLGISMQEVAEMNIKKLRDRQQRGVLSGSGDSR